MGDIWEAPRYDDQAGQDRLRDYLDRTRGRSRLIGGMALYLNKPVCKGDDTFILGRGYEKLDDLPFEPLEVGQIVKLGQHKDDKVFIITYVGEQVIRVTPPSPGIFITSYMLFRPQQTLIQ